MPASAAWPVSSTACAVSLVPVAATSGTSTAARTARQTSTCSSSVSTEPSPVEPVSTSPSLPCSTSHAASAAAPSRSMRPSSVERGDHRGDQRSEPGHQRASCNELESDAPSWPRSRPRVASRFSCSSNQTVWYESIVGPGRTSRARRRRTASRAVARPGAVARRSESSTSASRVAGGLTDAGRPARRLGHERGRRFGGSGLAQLPVGAEVEQSLVDRQEPLVGRRPPASRPPAASSSADSLEPHSAPRLRGQRPACRPGPRGCGPARPPPAHRGLVRSHRFVEPVDAAIVSRSASVRSRSASSTSRSGSERRAIPMTLPSPARPAGWAISARSLRPGLLCGPRRRHRGPRSRAVARAAGRATARCSSSSISLGPSSVPTQSTRRVEQRTADRFERATPPASSSARSGSCVTSRPPYSTWTRKSPAAGILRTACVDAPVDRDHRRLALGRPRPSSAAPTSRRDAAPAPSPRPRPDAPRRADRPDRYRRLDHHLGPPALVEQPVERRGRRRRGRARSARPRRPGRPGRSGRTCGCSNARPVPDSTDRWSRPPSRASRGTRRGASV